MTVDPGHYLEILGLEPGVSRADVKKAYRDLSKVWHPDRFTEDPGLQQKAEEQLKAINDAYQHLQNCDPWPESAGGGDGPRPPSPRRMDERILQPRKRFNPSERLPLVMTVVAVLVVLLLVLTAL